MSRRWKIVIGIAAILILAFVALMTVTAVYISRHARDWVVDFLTQEFKSDVELSSFKVSIPFPLAQIEGEALALHFEGRKDLPAMIAVKRFTVRTSLLGLLRIPRHIQYVHLDGLQINIPPRGERKSEGAGGARKAMSKFSSVRMDSILSENAVLKILTRKPGKDPLEFDIKQLNLHSTGSDGALAFRATLTNPTPPGEILSTGTFGPWNADAPSLTPVSGEYTFDNADLGLFLGIGGILSSKGTYQGVLEEIQTEGVTDTPDFRVTRAAHPVHLTTTFHATVDGTNGDTYLHPVETHFGKTILVAQGSVEGTAGKKGKTITLDVTGNQAQIEDLLLFALKGSPTMAGAMRLKTKFILTPGPREIPDRITLNGSFEIPSAHFTRGSMQQKVDNMSKRSQGDPKKVEDPQSQVRSDDVASAIKGNFRMQDGTLTLSRFGFAIPGANVHLDGTYSLDQESLDLHGKLEMEARLSQTTTGVKSFLLKAVDPFFSKNGKGTVLPIKITGPVNHPSYGLDLGRKDEAKN